MPPKLRKYKIVGILADSSAVVQPNKQMLQYQLTSTKVLIIPSGVFLTLLARRLDEDG